MKKEWWLAVGVTVLTVALAHKIHRANFKAKVALGAFRETTMLNEIG